MTHIRSLIDKYYEFPKNRNKDYYSLFKTYGWIFFSTAPIFSFPCFELFFGIDINERSHEKT